MIDSTLNPTFFYLSKQLDLEDSAAVEAFVDEEKPDGNDLCLLETKMVAQKK